MSVNGGFPAPGPQDRDQPRQGGHAAPPPPGSAGSMRPPSMPPPSTPPYSTASPLMQHTPMLTAHKPGIIALRPLQFGDILDGAIRAVRFNPKAMVGLSALVLAIFLVPSAAVGVGLTHLAAASMKDLGPEFQGFVGYPSAFVQTLFTTLATAILSGLLIQVVGQSVLGRRQSLGQTWQATRGRVPTLLALTFVTFLVTVLAYGILLLPGLLLMVNDNVGGGIALLLLGFLALIVFTLYFSTRISMAAPAVVLEGHGLTSGLRRSFALTAGTVFWRILGITLVASILAAIVGAILGAPFTIVSVVIQVVTGQGGEGSESGQITVSFIQHLSALLTGSVTTPFVAAVTGLLYIDRRMRLEALDVVLLREAQSNPDPRM
jgi:hypothetical protein